MSTACICSFSRPEPQSGSNGSSSTANAANSGSAPPRSSRSPRPANWPSPTACWRGRAAIPSCRSAARRAFPRSRRPPSVSSNRSAAAGTAGGTRRTGGTAWSGTPSPASAAGPFPRSTRPTCWTSTDRRGGDDLGSADEGEARAPRPALRPGGRGPQRDQDARRRQPARVPKRSGHPAGGRPCRRSRSPAPTRATGRRTSRGRRGQGRTRRRAHMPAVDYRVDDAESFFVLSRIYGTMLLQGLLRGRAGPGHQAGNLANNLPSAPRTRTLFLIMFDM